MAGSVCACTRPTGDGAVLCVTCGTWLARYLRDVTALVYELATTRSRQSRTGGQAIGGGHSSDRPLPWDQRASEATDVLRVALVGAARVVLEQHPSRPGGPRCTTCAHPSCLAYALDAPANSLPAISRWLLHHVDWIRHRDEAEDILTEIRAAVRRCRNVIDRRPDLSYLGPCGEQIDPWTDGRGLERTDCPEELWVPTGKAKAPCRACLAEHDVELRRAWALAAAEQQLETAAVISQALSRLGQEVTASQIRGWAFRGRLVAHGTDQDDRPLYRVGEVIDLLASFARRAEELDRKREAKIQRRTG
ncbi:MAG: hypothetical protein JWO67_6452 [Streptosporangiaceae bacterium]|nr:hypothetical protein [Streptosporangiaceae bacterium]